MAIVNCNGEFFLLKPDHFRSAKVENLGQIGRVAPCYCFDSSLLKSLFTLSRLHCIET